MCTDRLKILEFEYLIYLLLSWYKELHPNENPILSFSRLKSLKLLFLVSAVNASEGNEGLLGIFDKFYAMQHGPVESDIYKAMTLDETIFFSYKNRITDYKGKDARIFDNIEFKTSKIIKESVDALKKINPKIVEYKPFDLVNITHKWNSWQVAFEMAQIFGKGSESMSIESIKKDTKYFF